MPAQHTVKIPREGVLLLAFWATDSRNNPLTPAGGKPGPTESLGAYCGRLPDHCLTVKVDNLKPTLTRDWTVFNATRTEVQVPFSSTDEHSIVRTVVLAGTENQARIEMDQISAPGVVPVEYSKSRGTLILTSSNGAEVYGQVTVVDYAGWSRTFTLPLVSDYAPKALDDFYCRKVNLRVARRFGIIR